MNPDESTTLQPISAQERRLPVGPLLFCVALALAGAILIGIAVWRMVSPSASDPVPKRDVAEEARQLVRLSKPAPLSEPLAKILADAGHMHFESYQHSLIGKPAPEFTKPNLDGKPWSLHENLKKGPVVVIFYLGYYCNHCVSQLFDANEDYRYFRELGAEVVALSPDSAVVTKGKYKEYGPFAFPVLSDPDNKTAEAYGVYLPPKEGKPGDLMHGTFVVGQDGVVHWAAFGATPFGHNPTLLYELKKLEH
jgi:peroxiredoxin